MSANDRSVGARARATSMVDLIKTANTRGLFALTAPNTEVLQ